MAKIIDSDHCDQPGILSKIDRLCRRILPGYNYIRNRRSGSRVLMEARRVCSGFGIPAKFRGKNRSTAKITDEIYLGAGISKSEFCKKLEDLLRKKLIVMQERMKQVDLDQDQDQEDKEFSSEKDHQKQDHGNVPSEQEDDESPLVERPLVSPEVRQRMIEAMIHQSGQEPIDNETLQEIPSQKTLEDKPHSSSKTSAPIEDKEPSDDIPLKDNNLEDHPEQETEMDTQPERNPTPNSLLDYFLS